MVMAKLDQIVANASKGKSKKGMSDAVAANEEIRKWVNKNCLICLGRAYVDLR